MLNDAVLSLLIKLKQWDQVKDKYLIPLIATKLWVRDSSNLNSLVTGQQKNGKKERNFRVGHEVYSGFSSDF
jgi:hypothetical protein